jgi:TetR/AcrR family transcriptional regulator, mexJK operon transcriptional repressor
MSSSIGGARRAPVKVKRKRPNQAGRPTASELERRKGRVMEVATDLFVERGFAATSLVDIARGAGVATRTLYQHFGDKEAIFREVIFARDAEAALQPPKVESGDTLYDALLNASDYAYTITYRERSIGLMRLMIAESNRFPEFMQSIAKTIFSHFRHNIEKVLEALEAAGLIPNGDHARSAELFSDLVLGSHPLMTYTNWDAALPGKQDVEERLEMFIMGRFGPTVAKNARSKKVK